MNISMRLKIQQCISSVSSRFLFYSDFNKAVDSSLKDLGLLSHSGRAYLFIINSDSKTMDNTHEWCAPGVEPQIDNLQGLSLRMFPWWMDKLRNNEIIHIRDVNAMPRTASEEKAILENQHIKSLLVFPVNSGKRLLGFLGFDDVAYTGRWRRQDIELLRLSSGIMAAAIERRRIEQKLQKKSLLLAASNKNLNRLSSRMLSVIEDEAKRIAADLHDETGNFAVMFGSELSILYRDLQARNFRKAMQVTVKCRDQLVEFTARLKNIAVQLRPPALQLVGLDGALKQYFNDVEIHTGLHIHFEYRGSSPMPDENVAILVFRVIQEAIINVIKHGHAHIVTVRIANARSLIRVSIHDDGIGFDAYKSGDNAVYGIGIFIMQERIKSLGGKLEIRSEKNKGTTLSFDIKKQGLYANKCFHRR